MPRAAVGDGLQMSRAVRDKVMEERASVLVRDTAFDSDLRGSQTIVGQSIRSLMAVPLQTGEAVIGMIYVDAAKAFRSFTEEDLQLLTVLANTAAIRIEHARIGVMQETERIMQRELAQAAEIQRGFLPAVAPEVAGLELAGHSISCRSVGGDYFDYLPTGDGALFVMVADVAGKGLPAALLMTSLQARVHLLAEAIADPGEFLTRLNAATAKNCPDNRFITAVWARLESSGELHWASAGHNPPLLLRASGQVETLADGGPPLGVMARFTYKTYHHQLGSGDALILYSDGATEARAPNDAEYGEDRFLQTLAGFRGQGAADVLAGLWSSVAEFMSTAPACDDITIVVVRRRA
jgi:serine phosphatase RsbU (regulator of sigma subunit)